MNQIQLNMSLPRTLITIFSFGLGRGGGEVSKRRLEAGSCYVHLSWTPLFKHVYLKPRKMLDICIYFIRLPA